MELFRITNAKLVEAETANVDKTIEEHIKRYTEIQMELLNIKKITDALAKESNEITDDLAAKMKRNGELSIKVGDSIVDFATRKTHSFKQKEAFAQVLALLEGDTLAAANAIIEANTSKGVKEYVKIASPTLARTVEMLKKLKPENLRAKLPSMKNVAANAWRTAVKNGEIEESLVDINTIDAELNEGKMTDAVKAAYEKFKNLAKVIFGPAIKRLNKANDSAQKLIDFVDSLPAE